MSIVQMTTHGLISAQSLVALQMANKEPFACYFNLQGKTSGILHQQLSDIGMKRNIAAICIWKIRHALRQLCFSSARDKMLCTDVMIYIALSPFRRAGDLI